MSRINRSINRHVRHTPVLEKKYKKTKCKKIKKGLKIYAFSATRSREHLLRVVKKEERKTKIFLRNLRL